jgi:hypothetical protein
MTLKSLRDDYISDELKNYLRDGQRPGRYSDTFLTIANLVQQHVKELEMEGKPIRLGLFRITPTVITLEFCLGMERFLIFPWWTKPINIPMDRLWEIPDSTLKSLQQYEAPILFALCYGQSSENVSSVKVKQGRNGNTTDYRRCAPIGKLTRYSELKMNEIETPFTAENFKRFLAWSLVI